MPQRKRFEFPPMLGPPEEQPSGSAAWAMSVAGRIEMFVEKVDQFGVDHLCRYLTQVFKEPKPPWEVWPDPPCKTLDAFFPLCCGRTFEQIRALISDYLDDAELTRQLDAAKARADGKDIGQGTRTDLSEHRAYGTKLSRGSNHADHLLRRLSRDHPGTLAAYERGDYRSPRAAAIAAGIVKQETHLDKALRHWRLMTKKERSMFLREIGAIIS